MKKEVNAIIVKNLLGKNWNNKIKIPVIKKWNYGPTAEIIIHNLEQKIDILTYENFY